MFIRPRVLSILTTRRCTAACDHCCVGASPRAKDAIPIERIHGLIDEAQRIPSIERIVFTGGECFLLGKDLDALIAHAHELEFQTRVITNAYWAVNAHAARQRVRSLRTAGLDELMLSSGKFHQQFVPIERIVHAARAAALARIPVRISVEQCDQSEFSPRAFEEMLAPEIELGIVVVVSAPWLPDAGGRGRATLSHGNVDANAALGRCTEVMTVISVTPDQRLIACCGFPLEELPSLRIGSVADRAIGDALEQSTDDLMKMWLHIAGPAGIADFVSQYLPGYRLPPTASICQACVLLQRDKRAMAVVGQHAAELAASVTDAFLTLQKASTNIGTITLGSRIDADFDR